MSADGFAVAQSGAPDLVLHNAFRDDLSVEFESLAPLKGTLRDFP